MSRHNFHSVHCTEGEGRRGQEGIVPLKKLGGATEVLSVPQCLENVLQMYTVKTNKKNETRDHVA